MSKSVTDRVEDEEIQADRDAFLKFKRKLFLKMVIVIR